MDQSPSQAIVEELQIASVSEGSSDTAAKLDSDMTPRETLSPNKTSTPPQKDEAAELKQQTQSLNKLSKSSTPQRKDMSVTNPASKIPGIKRASNNLSLRKNQKSPIPSTDSKSSLASKRGIAEKRVVESNSKISFTSTKGGLVKPQANRLLESSGNKSERRPAAGSSLAAKREEAETKTNLRKITSTAGDQNKMEILEKKLTTAQTEFLTKSEALKQNSKNEYKLITLVRNGECKFMVNDDQLRKIPQKLPANSVNDFKEKLQTFMQECFTNFKGDVKEYPEEMQDSKYKALFELIDDLCNSYKDEANDGQVVKMQKDLQECKKSLKAAEAKLIEQSKMHEEEQTNVKNEKMSKALEELSHKEAQIKDLQKKLKSAEKQNDMLKLNLQTAEQGHQTEIFNVQEELKACRQSINSSQKKLNTVEEELALEREEVNSKNDTIKKLEADIIAMHAHIDDLKAKFEAENNSAELLGQITELRNVIENLEKQNSALEKTNEQLLKETSSNTDLLKKLQAAENRIQSLQEQLAASEKLNDSKPECQCPKDLQMELAKLRQSEAEKRREIEKLKVELSKSIFNITQLEEQIQRDQQLLEVRSDLINSLQTNDTNQRIHMDELFAQVGEKNSTINELNNELRTKSEDFRNLFTTVSSKQLELSNQEHMIKLLEESNERSQMLRVKQEEKIGRMEEDIAHLKQTIATYQDNALNRNGKFIYAPAMASSNENFNENFYYYTSERKRKRQIDINVKKYET